MTKVYINPNYGAKPDNADGGIRRVVEAQKKHLNKFGVTIVDHPEDADVINNHGASLVMVPGIPSVNSCHGFMWSKYDWGTWAHEINRRVVESMRQSVRHTAPSEWVKKAMVRGMLINPVTVYHGVDPDEWDSGQKKQDYVLWNKARQDKVSDPEDMNQVARLLPNVKFVSTLGRKTDNVSLCGVMPFDEMKHLIQEAGVYLATARETFGIGTLEALVCGVPVVGWDWGGQSEIIIHGETGYLAEPGDYKDLARGIEFCLENKDEMGEKARMDALERWGWEHRVEQYAKIFKEVHNEYKQKRPKVSVIVTTYNLNHYLPDALLSVQEQTEESWECIVVDDCGTDSASDIVELFAKEDSRFKYFRPESNLGLSLARNFGVEKSTGQYIIMLDADDMLDIHALEILSGELDKDWGIHVAYGHLDTFTDGDPERKRNNWPLDRFNWRQQMAHLNQLPYSAMMRREVFENTGGYRKRHWRAEDAAFWCRVSSFGYRIVKVTQASTLVYRMRGDSKSNQEPGDGDWTAWYPWRIAGNPREGSERIRDGFVVPQHFIPWGAPEEQTKGYFWDIPDRADPFVSIIVPVGPGHEDVVIDALESVIAQTYMNWELIVVNDTDKLLNLKHAPYAQVYNVAEFSPEGGPSHARNIGALHAKGETLLWLDADDFLLPGAIQAMVEEYNDNGPCIVYTDWLKNEGDKEKKMEYYETFDFECGAVLNKMQHSITCLVPHRSHKAIGGFDVEIDGWEDWDYFIALQDQGLCSYRIPEPLFIYRFYGGERREDSFEKRESLLEYIKEKWSKYYVQEEDMPCGGCPSSRRKPTRRPAASVNEKVTANTAMVHDGYNMVLMEYIGRAHGPWRVNGNPPTNAKYKFGKTQSNKFGYVYPHDVEYLLGKRNQDGTSIFRIVPPPPKVEEEVQPEDFVGQGIEKTPEPKPEPEETEPFVFDVDINDFTVADIKKTLSKPEYQRQDILFALYKQEGLGKNRKTVIKFLEDKLAKFD